MRAEVLCGGAQLMIPTRFSAAKEVLYLNYIPSCLICVIYDGKRILTGRGCVFGEDNKSCVEKE